MISTELSWSSSLTKPVQQTRRIRYGRVYGSFVTAWLQGFYLDERKHCLPYLITDVCVQFGSHVRQIIPELDAIAWGSWVAQELSPFTRLLELVFFVGPAKPKKVMRNAMSVGTRSRRIGSRRIDWLDQLIVESLTHIVFLVFFFLVFARLLVLGILLGR